MSTQVYLSTDAAEELRAIRALLPDYLGALRPARVVDEQSAAFTSDHVLRLVEAHRSEVAKMAQSSALIGRTEALRGILNHQQLVAAGNVD